MNFKPAQKSFVLEHPPKTKIEARQMTLDFLLQLRLSHLLYCTKKPIQESRRRQNYLIELKGLQDERIGHWLATEDKILSQLKSNLDQAYEAYEARRDHYKETLEAWKTNMKALTAKEEAELREKTPDSNPIDYDQVVLRHPAWVIPERKVLVKNRR